MARIGSIKCDTRKERDGVWMDFEAGIRFKVASTSSPVFRDALRLAVDAKKASCKVTVLSDEQFDDARKEAVANAIVLDWENVEDDSGKPLAFNAKTALEWFRDPELHRLWEWVLFSAVQDQYFRKAVLVDAEKN